MSRVFCWLNGLAVGWSACTVLVNKTVFSALLLAFNLAVLALMVSLFSDRTTDGAK
jgi:NADH:ubiquinone oxidoreductase subunit 6 (subunit J)